MGSTGRHKSAPIFHRRSTLRHFEILADTLREVFVDLVVPRNGRDFAGCAIYIDGMRAAFTQEFTTVRLEMAQQIPTFHQAAGRRSLMTE